MSMHSQLLRGVLALPLMLLLALAGLVAPDATPATPTLPPAVGAIDVEGRVVVVLRTEAQLDCVRALPVQVASR